jgi:tetratricopeptide (TPR) repeat protein
MEKFLLALAATLILTSNALSAEKTSTRESDLVAYEKLTQINLDAVKESVQKDVLLMQNRVDAQDKRIDRQDKLLDVQTGRISDLSISLTVLGSVFALIAVLAGWIGFVTVKNRAKEEARQAAIDWFAKEGNDQIRKLLAIFEKHLDLQKSKVDETVLDLIKRMQERIQATPDRREPPASVPVGGDPLQQLVEQLKHKPESDYAFNDWNARAFDVYRQGNLALAAEYWLKAANSRNPSRIETAISVFNAALVSNTDGKRERALELYDELLARFGTATEVELREQIAKALVNKGIVLGELGRYEDAIKITDDVLARFGMATELSLRQQVAGALVSKSFDLGKLGRNEDAIKITDDVLARFGMATEVELRGQVARALGNKGFILGQLGRHEDAIKVYDDLLVRIGTATEVELREQVARALGNKGIALDKLGHHEDAIKSFDDVLVRLGTATELVLRRQVAMALLMKGYSIGQLGRYEDEIKIYDDVLARFGTATEVELREQVAGAENGKGFAQLTIAKQRWTNKAERQLRLQQALECFVRALAVPTDRAMVLGNQAYALFFLGRSEDAHSALKQAFAEGGVRSRDLELKDTELFTVPEDEGFRSLISKVWGELHPES